MVDALNADPRCEGTVARLPMDGFHLSNAELEAVGLADRKGAPATFDVAGFAGLLRRAAEEPGRALAAPAFDRAGERTVPAALTISARVRLVVAEGNYLLHDGGGWVQVRPLLDEAWFVRVDPDLQYARLVERHRVAKGGRPGAVRWVENNDLPNSALVLATESAADVVIEIVEPPTR